MSEQLCPNCSQRLHTPVRFCPTCGTYLAQGIPPTSVGEGDVATHQGRAPSPDTAVGQSETALRRPQTLWWITGASCLTLLLVVVCLAGTALVWLSRTNWNTPPLVAPSAQPGGGLISGDPLVPESTQLLQENFDNPDSSVLSNAEDSFARYAFVDGAYQMQVKQPERLAWSIVGGPYRDLRVSVESSITPNDPVAAVGLIFHYRDEGNFYLYSITNDGFYALELLLNNQWITLIDWTPSEFIDPRDNLLSIATSGDRIDLYINGSLLETTRDNSFTVGSVGIGVTSLDEIPATVNFDNLLIVRP